MFSFIPLHWECSGRLSPGARPYFSDDCLVLPISRKWKMTQTKMRFLCLLVVSVRLCACHEGHDHDHLDGLYHANKCFCCPWKLVQVDGCAQADAKNASFDEEELSLRFFSADWETKNRYESLVMHRLSFVGIGVGMIHDVGRCIDGPKMHQPTWSINHRTVPDVQIASRGWQHLQEKIENSLYDRLRNISTEGDIQWMMYHYREIYRRFDRSGDCGRPVTNGEKRCLHHVISPLNYENNTHHIDFQNLAITGRVSTGVLSSFMHPVQCTLKSEE